MFLYYTGMRSKDASHIKWSQVDMKRKVIVFKAGKTGLSQSVQIVDHLHEKLESLEQTDSLLVFPEISNKRRRDTVRIHLHRILKKYDIPDAGLHSFRHSFASHLLSDGVPVFHVQKLLGHKLLETTQIYAHHAKENEIDINSYF